MRSAAVMGRNHTYERINVLLLLPLSLYHRLVLRCGGVVDRLPTQRGWGAHGVQGRGCVVDAASLAPDVLQGGRVRV